MTQKAFTFPSEGAETGSDNALSLPRVDYQYPDAAPTWNGLALIGEAPGADEVRLGKPFVGRSGQLLDQILAKAGIDRKACFVGNVFRLRPPANKVDHFFISRRKAGVENIGIAETFGKFGSNYCRADYADEIDHLVQTLQRIKPRAIVALGRTPFWALTGENGLLEKIGQPMPCRLYAGASVMPTYHPSFILRGNWGLQDAWANHIRQANSGR